MKICRLRKVTANYYKPIEAIVIGVTVIVMVAVIVVVETLKVGRRDEITSP